MLERLQQTAVESRQAAEGLLRIGVVRSISNVNGEPVCTVETTGRRGQTITLFNISSAVPVQVGHLVQVSHVDGNTTREAYITGYARPAVAQNLDAEAPYIEIDGEKTYRYTDDDGNVQETYQSSFFGGDNPWNVGDIGRIGEGVTDPNAVLGGLTVTSPGQKAFLIPPFSNARLGYEITVGPDESRLILTVTPRTGSTSGANISVTTTPPAVEGTPIDIVRGPQNWAVSIPMSINNSELTAFRLTATRGDVSQVYTFDVSREELHALGSDSPERTVGFVLSLINPIASQVLAPGSEVITDIRALTSPDEVPDIRFRRRFHGPIHVVATSNKMTFECEWRAPSVIGQSLSAEVLSEAAFIVARSGTTVSIDNRTAPMSWRLWVVLKYTTDERLELGEDPTRRIVGKTVAHSFFVSCSESYDNGIQLAAGFTGVFNEDVIQASLQSRLVLNRLFYDYIDHSWTVEFDTSSIIGKTAEVELYVQNAMTRPHLGLFTVGNSFFLKDGWEFQMREIGEGSGL